MITFPSPQPGEVWFSRWEFPDVPGHYKYRPILILNWIDGRGVAAKITSHPPREMSGEVFLHDWRQAGLLKPSTVRCSQLSLFTIADLARDQAFGRLTERDWVSVSKAIEDFAKQPPSK